MRDEGGRCACRGWSLASGSSFLSCSFFLLQMGRYVCKHFITFPFFLALNQLITWTAAPVWTILPPSAVQQGPPSDTSVPTLPAVGGEGGAFLNESWDWRVVPRRLLRRGNVQKVLGGEGVAGRGVRGGRGLKRLRLGGEWLCRLLEPRSCC